MQEVSTIIRNENTMRKKLFLLVGIMIIVACIYLIYQYNRKPADIKNEEAVLQITAKDLIAAFDNDEVIANEKYTGKVITVSGTVAQVQTETADQITVFLASNDPLSSVTCSFYKDEVTQVKDLQPGQKVSIKGVCTGKLMDVVLNKCSLSN